MVSLFFSSSGHPASSLSSTCWLFTGEREIMGTVVSTLSTHNGRKQRHRKSFLPSARTHTLNCNTNLRDNAPTTCCTELNTSALISLLLYYPQISVVNKFIFSVTHKYYNVTDMKADI